MSERELAEALSRQVDEILARAGRRPEGEVVRIEGARDLEVARELATVDFAGESRALPVLKNQLPRSPRATGANRQPAWPTLLRLAPLGLAALVVSVGTISSLRSVAVPGLVRQVAAPVPRRPAAVTAPAAAVHLPGYVPKGYTLRDVQVNPSGTGYAAVYSSATRADIVFSASQPGPSGLSGAGDWIRYASAEVDSAASSRSRQLVWEADGASYTVSGLDLTVDEAASIVRSVR